MQSGGESTLVVIYGVIALFLLISLMVYEIIYARHHKLKTALPIVKNKNLALDTHAVLQRQIDEATAELRKANDELRRLDETKNEFVSMASHQLRTPLTSIKGYISMVLEGDAGSLNDDQRKLLTEAFTSSERMVRLIGDFLNVSRLQNGKFMIDRSVPVDLSAVVTEEIQIVTEIAEARGIGIAYHKPSRYPVLFIDEDKIRQVIMNLLDNAIFYSGDSKVVTVRLYSHDGAAIFEVTDHGIGVPAPARKHLFTKFYRADNAQTQRPDGTGVGLYLAKQVVAGHGGSVMFAPKAAGTGSTFGFRLPIKKLSTAAKVK